MLPWICFGPRRCRNATDEHDDGNSDTSCNQPVPHIRPGPLGSVRFSAVYLCPGTVGSWPGAECWLSQPGGAISITYVLVPCRFSMQLDMRLSAPGDEPRECVERHLRVSMHCQLMHFIE